MWELTESKEQGQILLGIVCRKSMHIHIMASLKDLDTGQRRRQRLRIICLNACILCNTMNFLQHGHEWRKTTSGMRHPLLSLLFFLSLYLPLPSLSISLFSLPPPPLPFNLSFSHAQMHTQKQTHYAYMHICMCNHTHMHQRQCRLDSIHHTHMHQRQCAGSTRLITHKCIKGDAGSTRFIF